MLWTGLTSGLAAIFWTILTVHAVTLEEVKQRGVLLHLGVPYAHFVKKEGDGLDQEMIRLFAEHLGVRYEWVETTWSEAFSNLTGTRVEAGTGRPLSGEPAPVRGDLIANGLTILPWREKLAVFSIPTFPTGVWLMSRADSTLRPIMPSGSIEADIEKVMSLLKGFSVLTMKGTCLDPSLYGLKRIGVEIRFLKQGLTLDDMVPAMIDGAADATILDIPDALVALDRRPGEIKVIGPVSKPQLMGVAFSRDSAELAGAFNRFFQQITEDGTYRKLVEKHYPLIFLYLGDFFTDGGRP